MDLKNLSEEGYSVCKYKRWSFSKEASTVLLGKEFILDRLDRDRCRGIRLDNTEDIDGLWNASGVYSGCKTRNLIMPNPSIRYANDTSL